MDKININVSRKYKKTKQPINAIKNNNFNILHTSLKSQHRFCQSNATNCLSKKHGINSKEQYFCPFATAFGLLGRKMSESARSSIFFSRSRSVCFLLSWSTFCSTIFSGTIFFCLCFLILLLLPGISRLLLCE